MSNDEKWLDVGAMSELIEEFNEHAPYGLEHRRQQEVSFSFQLAQRNLRDFMEVVFARETALAEIKRLFKPLPNSHLD